MIGILCITFPIIVFIIAFLCFPPHYQGGRKYYNERLGKEVLMVTDGWRPFTMVENMFRYVAVVSFIASIIGTPVGIYLLTSKKGDRPLPPTPPQSPIQ